MRSLVGRKNLEERLQRLVIEASLELDLHFGHSKCQFLNGVDSTN
jgi:hypothetical protein